MDTQSANVQLHENTFEELAMCSVTHFDTTQNGCWIMKFAGHIHPPLMYQKMTVDVKTVYSKIYG